MCLIYCEVAEAGIEPALRGIVTLSALSAMRLIRSGLGAYAMRNSSRYTICQQRGGL